MMNTSVVEGLEEQLKAAKDAIEYRDSAIRLAKNRDFRRLILDGFCEADAARHVRMSTDPNLSPVMQADALGMAQAGGYLKRHLHAIMQLGATADKDAAEIELELEEARAEELASLASEDDEA